MSDSTARKYHILLHAQAYQSAADYLLALQAGSIRPGRHHNPVAHAEPFSAHLLFTAGALLRNGRQLDLSQANHKYRDVCSDQ